MSQTLMPTVTFIELNKKVRTLTSQKSRAKQEGNTEQAEAYQRKINMVKDQIKQLQNMSSQTKGGAND